MLSESPQAEQDSALARHHLWCVGEIRMTFATLRLIQQSYWFHALVAAFLAGLTAYFTASPSMALSAGITAFVLSIQHSPGSASFKDGSPNTADNNVVKIQAAAADGR